MNAKIEEFFPSFENARLLNFGTASDRKRMEVAIQKVKKELGQCYGLHTGKRLSSRTDKAVASVNPANTNEVVGYVEYAEESDLEAALALLEQGAKSWRMRSFEERSHLIMKLADWYEEHRDELSAWMVFESGKTWREADADTAEAIDFCRYYAQEIMRVGPPRLTQKRQGETNHLSYRGRGVAAVIAPWNFPLAILTGMTAASLVCGNTVLIKPAEQTSVIASFLARALSEVGFPEDSFYFLPAEGERLGPRIVSDPRVDVIAFTGSVQVGLSIIEGAAKPPKPGQRGVKKVVAEMGGKNALIIDEDADLDEAVAGAIQSAFGFQGQKCSALSRLLVHSNVYDQFVSRFVEATKSLKIGPPADPQFQLGPVIDEEARKRIQSTIDQAASRLNTLYKKEALPSEGFFVGPAIFEVNSIDDEIFQNEIFGPVVAVMKIESLEQGIEALNSVRFALTGGLFSRSPSHIEKAKELVEVGNFYINRGITGAVVQRQPFGGFKFSGVGSKAGGPEYLVQFMEPRTVTENTVRRGFASDTVS